MARQICFRSPLPAEDAIRQLERFASQPPLLLGHQKRTTKIVVSALDVKAEGNGHFSFQLAARCHDHSYRSYWGGTVFLRARGRVEQTTGTTRVCVSVGLGLPATAGEWVAQVVWYVVLASALGLLAFAALWTGDRELWDLAGGVVLGIAALYLLLARVYRQAVKALSFTLKRVLTEKV